ncbi:hypothetical protein [Shewanella frigidimarina]|uniref:hypothetical protein n=1 Tax=Shewanella frigidimarina TaxID=56812 RepID=UPI003D78FFEE
MPTIKLGQLRDTMMLLSTRHWAWLLAALLLILVICWDGLNRINISSQISVNQYEMGTFSVVDNNLPAIMALNINQLYANYDLPVAKITENEQGAKLGMTEKEQLLQQGELTKLFIGEHQYRLLGIFSDKQFYAVLIKTELTTHKTEEIKVTLSQKVQQYSIEAITSNHVELVDGERRIKLFMFDS